MEKAIRDASNSCLLAGCGDPGSGWVVCMSGSSLWPSSRGPCNFNQKHCIRALLEDLRDHMTFFFYAWRGRGFESVSDVGKARKVGPSFTFCFSFQLVQVAGSISRQEQKSCDILDGLAQLITHCPSYISRDAPFVEAPASSSG